MSTIFNREEFERSQSSVIYRPDGSRCSVTRRESVYIDEEIPVDDSVYLGIDFQLYKAREDQGLVSGWANVALDKDGNAPIDWQGDTISPATLEKAAIAFMQDYRSSGVMHKGTSKGTVVESIVLTKEKQQALGIPEGIVPEGWFITVKVHDPDVFAKVKDGTFKMFSIQGKAQRVDIT